MQDEARHVAFGRLALRDYYARLTEAERAEREEFVVEGCYLMRDRIRGEEVYELLGLPVKRCLELNDNSEYYQIFRNLLFTRIVPTVRDIGLWGPKVQKAYADMGVRVLQHRRQHRLHQRLARLAVAANVQNTFLQRQFFQGWQVGTG